MTIDLGNVSRERPHAAAFLSFGMDNGSVFIGRVGRLGKEAGE